MAVTYAASLRTARLQLVSNLLGAATAPTIPLIGTAAGSLVIGTDALSGSTGVLASVALPTTPATVVGDTLTLEGVPLTANATATGVAAKAELRANDGTVVVSGLTVGLSEANIIVSDTSIFAGQVVTVTSGTIAHATA